MNTTIRKPLLRATMGRPRTKARPPVTFQQASEPLPDDVVDAMLLDEGEHGPDPGVPLDRAEGASESDVSSLRPEFRKVGHVGAPSPGYGDMPVDADDAIAHSLVHKVVAAAVTSLCKRARYRVLHPDPPPVRGDPEIPSATWVETHDADQLAVWITGQKEAVQHAYNKEQLLAARRVSRDERLLEFEQEREEGLRDGQMFPEPPPQASRETRESYKWDERSILQSAKGTMVHMLTHGRAPLKALQVLQSLLDKADRDLNDMLCVAAPPASTPGDPD